MTRIGETVSLDKGTWTLTEELGQGGFGEVYKGIRGVEQAAIKFIPKSKGVPRELLLDIPEDASNVIPITDTGDEGKNWIIAMPVADLSLESFVATHGGKLPEESAVTVLADIADALVSLDGKIVHRDIKPGNILFLNGKWCLTDFGIARYAAAATGTETHKGFGSLHYIAPEIWKGESATSQSDIYALGVVAYQLLTGRVPFDGSFDEIHSGHLNDHPAPTGLPARLDWLIRDSLKKIPGVRPTAEQFKDRLAESTALFNSPAAMALAQVNEDLRSQQDEAERRMREYEAAEDLKRQRVSHAGDLHARISEEVFSTLMGFADLASLKRWEGGGGILSFGRGTLTMSPIMPNLFGNFSPGEDDPFEVLATAQIDVTQDLHRKAGYLGRSHALWYADVKQKGNFQWYEVAFIESDGAKTAGGLRPSAADVNSPEAFDAIRGAGNHVVAWPFTFVDADNLGEFIDRWGVWFAKAATGGLEFEPVVDATHTEKSWR